MTHPPFLRLPVLAPLATALLLASGCGGYQSWQEGRQVAALESSIEAQRAELQNLSENELERRERESREKAIEQYERILREYADVGREELDEALYLLGRLLFDRERGDFQRAQARWSAAEARGAVVAASPLPNHAGSRTVFERLLREFPGSAYRADALYELGYLRIEEGEIDAGIQYLRQLVREHPDSRYAAEVQFRLGEYEFENFELDRAEAHYRSVLALGESEFSDKARFKLGWVYYNLDRWAEAKGILGALLDRQTRQIEREGGEIAPSPILFFPGPRRIATAKLTRSKRGDLYQETLEIIARVFAESGGAGGLKAFLRLRGDASDPKHAAPLLHRLALVYKERSQLGEASEAYEALLRTFPNDRNAPEVEQELVDVLLLQQQVDRAAKVRETLIDKYDTNSTWARANPEQEIRSSALKTAREALEWSIQYFHSKGLEAQKESGGVPRELQHAIRLYEKHLARFPDEDTTLDKRMLYAQALFAARDYARAEVTFREVAFDPRAGQRREEAAFSRVLSAEKLAEGASDPPPRAVRDRLVAAYEEFVQLNPQSEKVAPLLFKEGQAFFKSKDYPQSIAVFGRLIGGFPQHPLAAEAQDLVAQSHFQLGQYAEAERWSRSALRASQSSGALAERRGQVEKLYALTVFKQGEQADTEEQHPEAASHYLRLVQELPRHETAPRSLYNAAAAIERGGNRASAATLFERVLAEYPTSELAPDAAVRLADIYKEGDGGAVRVLRVYERVSDYLPRDPRGEEFLFLAGKLAVSEKLDTEVLRLFEKYLTRYPATTPGPRGDRNLEALAHLGQTYFNTGSRRLARFNLEQFLARAEPRRATIFGGNAAETQQTIARANLILGRLFAEDYRAMRITHPVEVTLGRKERSLDALISRLRPAIASGISPIATEASFLVGDAQEDLARKLSEAPKPPGLMPEEIEEYEQLLQESLRPYRKAALDTYNTTLQAAARNDVADEWVERCRGRITALAASVLDRQPRPAYIRLGADDSTWPAFLTTLGGNEIAVQSDSGFFGGIFSDQAANQRAKFGQALGAARRPQPDWAQVAALFRESGNGAEAQYNAALALGRGGRREEALAAATGATTANPEFQAAWLLVARLSAEVGRSDAAAAAYARAGQISSTSIEDRLALASLLERQGRREEALSAYRDALGQDPRSGRAALGAARLGEAGNRAELEAMLSQLAGAPTDLVNLGILAVRRGAADVALRAFRSARQSLSPNDVEGRATVLNNEALAALALGKLSEAESLAGASQQTQPGFPAAQNTLGMVRMQQGQYDAAGEAFRQAASQGFSAPWVNLGILQEVYLGLPKDAIASYQRYIASRPPDADQVTGWIREIQEGQDV